MESASWKLEDALSLYYESQDGDLADQTSDMDEDDTAQGSGAAGASSSSRPSRPPPNQARIRTLRDMQGNAAGDDSGDEDDDKQDFFAGGEKSGLAVQNPNNPNNNSGNRPDHFNSLMNQARQ